MFFTECQNSTSFGSFRWSKFAILVGFFKISLKMYQIWQGLLKLAEIWTRCPNCYLEFEGCLLDIVYIFCILQWTNEYNYCLNYLLFGSTPSTELFVYHMSHVYHITWYHMICISHGFSTISCSSSIFKLTNWFV